MDWDSGYELESMGIIMDEERKTDTDDKALRFVIGYFEREMQDEDSTLVEKTAREFLAGLKDT
ncbi:MAG: hypothetical protein WCP12_14640 [bacterium]